MYGYLVDVLAGAVSAKGCRQKAAIYERVSTVEKDEKYIRVRAYVYKCTSAHVSKTAASGQKLKYSYYVYIYYSVWAVVIIAVVVTEIFCLLRW